MEKNQQVAHKFAVSVDSTCDLYADEIKALGIDVAPLEFTMSRGDDVSIEMDNFTKPEQYLDFYQKLRDGVVAKTAILSVQAHIDLFTAMAKRGIKTALHLSQGYGLSPTVDNANTAIAEVKKTFPDINYVAVECDTTTIGEGMLVKVAVQMRDAGKTLDEAVATINSIKHHIQHFVLVNDLKFLARGGRISGFAAGVGSMLQIKPIIEFGRDGKLKVCRKEIGLKKAMRSIVNDYAQFTPNKEFPLIVVVHTGNEALAKELQAMLHDKYGVEPEIRLMGPIIAAHVGPDAVAYGFISNEDRPYA